MDAPPAPSSSLADMMANSPGDDDNDDDDDDDYAPDAATAIRIHLPLQIGTARTTRLIILSLAPSFLVRQREPPRPRAAAEPPAASRRRSSNSSVGIALHRRGADAVVEVQQVDDVCDTRRYPPHWMLGPLAIQYPPPRVARMLRGVERRKQQQQQQQQRRRRRQRGWWLWLFVGSDGWKTTVFCYACLGLAGLILGGGVFDRFLPCPRSRTTSSTSSSNDYNNKHKDVDLAPVIGDTLVYTALNFSQAVLRPESLLLDMYGLLALGPLWVMGSRQPWVVNLVEGVELGESASKQEQGKQKEIKGSANQQDSAGADSDAAFIKLQAFLDTPRVNGGGSISDSGDLIWQLNEFITRFCMAVDLQGEESSERLFDSDTEAWYRWSFEREVDDENNSSNDANKHTPAWTWTVCARFSPLAQISRSMPSHQAAAKTNNHTTVKAHQAAHWRGLRQRYFQLATGLPLKHTTAVSSALYRLQVDLTTSAPPRGVPEAYFRMGRYRPDAGAAAADQLAEDLLAYLAPRRSPLESEDGRAESQHGEQAEGERERGGTRDTENDTTLIRAVLDVQNAIISVGTDTVAVMHAVRTDLLPLGQEAVNGIRFAAQQMRHHRSSSNDDDDDDDDDVQSNKKKNNKKTKPTEGHHDTPRQWNHQIRKLETAANDAEHMLEGMRRIVNLPWAQDFGRANTQLERIVQRLEHTGTLLVVARAAGWYLASGEGEVDFDLDLDDDNDDDDADSPGLIRLTLPSRRDLTTAAWTAVEHLEQAASMAKQHGLGNWIGSKAVVGPAGAVFEGGSGSSESV